MPTPQNITDQQDLLDTYRRTLAVYLRQKASTGMAQTPPATINGIREAREHIRNVKEALRSWGVTVEDLPDDIEKPIQNHSLQSSEQLPYGLGNINTGRDSINVGVGNLPNANIHIGNTFDSSVLPYEFIEVRFFARAYIVQTPIQVKQLFFFTGTEMVWPPQIEYELVISTTGSLETEQVVEKGTTQFVRHAYLDNYNNSRSHFSMQELIDGRSGSHKYYPIDLSSAQRYLVQYINMLGAQRWELVSFPQSLGVVRGKFNIEISKPHQDSWDFSGGEQRFYLGQDSNNPYGIAYSLKRSRTP